MPDDGCPIVSENSGSEYVMLVICPRCRANIEVVVTSFHPIRWGVSDFSSAEKICHEWRDPANAAKKANHICDTLDQAVIDAVVPSARDDDK
jgi:hypothetical protein